MGHNVMRQSQGEMVKILMQIYNAWIHNQFSVNSEMSAIVGVQFNTCDQSAFIHIAYSIIMIK